MTSLDTHSALDRLIRSFEDHWEHTGYPSTPYDPEWPGPCYRHEASPGQEVSWRPVLNTAGSDMFERLGDALETPVHPDISAYFCRYWSDPLLCRLDDGRTFSLLFAWNEADMERLRGNLIGHALSKRKQKRPLTLFFATLEPDTDYFLSLDNQDGSIWLERPGKPPEEKVEDSLSALLLRLTPA